ncbi:hypothetical protein NP493_500g01018 [Ridgeia piscesae]|uniref:Uncharacterized protein n=1 Tax=Ridgeia piscesae TaxID=27915 RepID=A0AAD9NSS4_RIDPI|nr:hypothetical protein NP493_500g01018 [Ridgeia piscesae]
MPTFDIAHKHGLMKNNQLLIKTKQFWQAASQVQLNTAGFSSRARPGPARPSPDNILLSNICPEQHLLKTYAMLSSYTTHVQDRPCHVGIRRLSLTTGFHHWNNLFLCNV